eukprot:gene9169-9942_t
MIKNGLDINIELVKDGQPNAYIYGFKVSDGIHKSRKIFGTLYRTLIEAKNKYPNNQLVKFLSSSNWGFICRFNEINKTIDEIVEEDIKFTRDKFDTNADYYISDHNGKYYTLVNIKKPFKFNIARIKPFLLSMGRVITGNVAFLHFDDLVRIHTDGIVFDEEHDEIMSAFKSYPKLLKENKTMGLIDWQTCNDYHNFNTNESHGKYKLL